jgi:hypothetical protein
MRKLLAGLFAFSLLATTLVAPATANRGDRAGKAMGAVRFTVSAGQDEQAAFWAVDRGAAAIDRGKIHYRNATAGFSYRARLACVDVEGATARFGYVIPSGEGVPVAIRGLGVVFQVVDGGKSGDTVAYVSGPAAAATACDTASIAGAQAIAAGNVRVKAAGTTQATKSRKHDRKSQWRKRGKGRDG